METAVYIIVGLILFSLFNMIRIAKDNDRFAVFSIGQFQGFKGPGLFFKFPGKEPQWIRLSVGNDGKLIAPSIAKFKDHDIPVEIDSKTPLDSRIRIIGFTDSVAKTMLSPNQNRKITCEKCGHEMHIN